MKEVGFIKDGFRNGRWVYNLPSSAKNITWDYYKNKNLNFETNLFEKADSVKHGNFFTKFLFQTIDGDVILSIAINSPFKDSTPQLNYRNLIENEFMKIGVMVISFKTRLIGNDLNEIYINEIKTREKITNEIKLLTTAFAFIDKNTFVDFSAISSESNVYREILFNAVLTNFFINGKRLYNPFRTNWLLPDAGLSHF